MLVFDCLVLQRLELRYSEASRLTNSVQEKKSALKKTPGVLRVRSDAEVEEAPRVSLLIFSPIFMIRNVLLLCSLRAKSAETLDILFYGSRESSVGVVRKWNDYDARKRARSGARARLLHEGDDDFHAGPGSLRRQGRMASTRSVC